LVTTMNRGFRLLVCQIWPREVFLLTDMLKDNIYSYLCIFIVRFLYFIVRVYVFLFLSMYSYCSSKYSYCCLCILTVLYVFLDATTLTEVFPCFFLGCKANVRV
jgi:hypothetical protein